MLSVTSFKGKSETKLVAISVSDSGMFQGEIRDMEHGTVESAVTAKTVAEVHKWLHERQTENVEWEEV